MLGKEHFIQHFNALNKEYLDFYKVRLTADDLAFGTPIPNDTVLNCDTEIELVSQTDQLVKGSKHTYYYARIPLATKIPPNAEIAPIRPDDVSSVIDEVNRLYGTTIDVDMVEDFLYDEANQQVWFAMRDDSLVWVGEVELTLVEIDLDDAIVVKQLDGLTYT